MKVFITFGQVHTHSVNGKTLDKDTIAVLNAPSVGAGHERAMELFNGVFHQALGEEPDISYFPKGLVYIDKEEH